MNRKKKHRLPIVTTSNNDLWCHPVWCAFHRLCSSCSCLTEDKDVNTVVQEANNHRKDAWAVKGHKALRCND